MPVIKVNYRDLKSLLGADISREEIIERLPMLGCDIEGYDEENIYVEFFPNRPDLYSVEGIARALRTFFGIEKGLKNYELKDSDIVLKVDKKVKKVRPYIVGAYVKNVELNDYLIEAYMELQEKLHWALGRDRKKVAIGLHDFSKVDPPFLYTTVEPSAIKFVPLGMSEELTPKEILEKHEKGREYGHIIKDFEEYPIIFDKNGNVLSMPPIINGELTRVTENTKELFIDITGTDFMLVNQALNILATAFAERGFEVYTINIEYEDRKIKTPNFKPDKKILSVDYTNKMLGLSLTSEEVAELLKKMGYNAEEKHSYVEVYVPCYRVDIFHEIDLVEDVAIAYGYENLIPTLPSINTVGKKEKLEKISEKIRQLMIGFGFFEVYSLMLTSDSFNKKAVKIRNPISEEHTIVRTSIIPSLLNFLKINKHKEMPLKVFEVGDVVYIEDSKIVERRRAGACIMHSRANFNEIKEIVEGFLTSLGIKYEIEECNAYGFIEGRSACILSNGKNFGYFGEISPDILEKYELSYPVAAFEIDIGEIL